MVINQTLNNYHQYVVFVVSDFIKYTVLQKQDAPSQLMHLVDCA